LRHLICANITLLAGVSAFAELKFLFSCFLADHYREEMTIMIIKTTSLALAAACLITVSVSPPAHAQTAAGTELVTNGPQTDPGDVSSAWSARQNVTDSQRYDRLLQTSRGFREARMRQECGPVTDPQLHANCLATFNQDEPYAASSAPPRRYPNGYER
jgi:hypothetical protein